MHRAAEHTGRRMSHITALAAGALVVLAPVLAGCGPSPAPRPTPTAAFASEEEAFAEAEKVYRAYNEAVNSERAGDVSADPLSYLTGAALEANIATSRHLDQSGLSLAGKGSVSEFEGSAHKTGPLGEAIELTTCLDVSATTVTNDVGEDVTPVDRPTRIRLRVEFIVDDGRLLISDSNVATDPKC